MPESTPCPRNRRSGRQKEFSRVFFRISGVRENVKPRPKARTKGKGLSGRGFESILKPWKGKDKTGFLKSPGRDVLACEQDLLRHFSKNQTQQKSGRAKKEGTVQCPGQRGRERIHGTRVGRDQVERAFQIGIIQKKQNGPRLIINMNPGKRLAA